MICVLHTFGRSLQWNPHIHCLITEGGIGNKYIYKHCAKGFYIF
nr:transposase [Pseudobutyrivibrio xylanivorans]